MKYVCVLISILLLVTLQWAPPQTGQVQDGSAVDEAVFKTHALQFRISD